LPDLRGFIYISQNFERHLQFKKVNDIINLKKRLSVNLAKAIEKPLRDYYGLFKISEKKDSNLLTANDQDKNSDFYFTIIKETHDSNGHFIHYSCKPFNNAKKDNPSTSTRIDNFVKVLTHWLENLKFYEEQSVLNDPIVRGYRNEFYTDFKIDDENADFEGFNYSQQRQLSQFFETISKDIDNLKEDQNEELIEEIKGDIRELKATVTTETKNGLMKKFSLVLAKARKGSIAVCDFILKEFAKEFLKEGAKITFNYIKTNAHKLPEYMQHLSETIKNN